MQYEIEKSVKHMLLILDGSSKYIVRVWTETSNLMCFRHSFTHRLQSTNLICATRSDLPSNKIIMKKKCNLDLLWTGIPGLWFSAIKDEKQAESIRGAWYSNLMVTQKWVRTCIVKSVIWPVQVFFNSTAVANLERKKIKKTYIASHVPNVF